MDILAHIIGALNGEGYSAYAEVPEFPTYPLLVVNLVGQGGRPWVRYADLAIDCYGTTMLSSHSLANYVLKFLTELVRTDDALWRGDLVTITNETDGERRLPCYRLDYTVKYKDFS